MVSTQESAETIRPKIQKHARILKEKMRLLNVEMAPCKREIQKMLQNG